MYAFILLNYFKFISNVHRFELYVFNFIWFWFYYFTFSDLREWNKIRYTNARFRIVHSHWYSETFVYAASLWFMAVLFVSSYPFNKITSIFPEWHYWDELFSPCCPDVLEYANFSWFILVRSSLISGNIDSYLTIHYHYIIITQSVIREISKWNLQQY